MNVDAPLWIEKVGSLLRTYVNADNLVVLDNAKNHNAAAVRDFFQNNQIQYTPSGGKSGVESDITAVKPYPAYSPDLNIAELIIARLKYVFWKLMDALGDSEKEKMQHWCSVESQPTRCNWVYKAELVLQEAARRVDADYVNSCYDRYNAVCQEVVAQNGKYGIVGRKLADGTRKTLLRPVNEEQ